MNPDEALAKLRAGLIERELFVDGTDEEVVATTLAIVDNNRYLQDLYRKLRERHT